MLCCNAFGGVYQGVVEFGINQAKAKTAGAAMSAATHLGGNL